MQKLSIQPLSRNALLLGMNVVRVPLSVYTPRSNPFRTIRLNALVFVQYNLKWSHHQLLHKTLDFETIVLEDTNPFLEWVVETQ